MTTPTPEPPTVAEVTRALAERVGLTGDEPPAIILAAVERALAERPAEGAVMVDQEALEQLERDAEIGRSGRERALVAAAINDGRIPPASRATWMTLLQVDPNAENTLASLRRNSVPISPMGYSDAADEQDALYDQVYRGGH